MEAETTTIQSPRRVPRKLDQNSDSEKFLLVAPTALLARVDEWRRKQPDIPNRSEAMRRLMALALDADDKRKR
jgi:metal-responsive CopG/Arc/MetJ family transcriptional regulator